VALLCNELNLADGPSLTETVDRAVQEVGLKDSVQTLSLIQKVDACLETVGVETPPEAAAGPPPGGGPRPPPMRGPPPIGFGNSYEAHMFGDDGYGPFGGMRLGGYGSWGGYSGGFSGGWGDYGGGWGGYGRHSPWEVSRVRNGGTGPYSGYAYGLYGGYGSWGPLGGAGGLRRGSAAERVLSGEQRPPPAAAGAGRRWAGMTLETAPGGRPDWAAANSRDAGRRWAGAGGGASRDWAGGMGARQQQASDAAGRAAQRATRSPPPEPTQVQVQVQVPQGVGPGDRFEVEMPWGLFELTVPNGVMGGAIITAQLPKPGEAASR